MADQDGVHGRIDSGRGRAIGDFEINDLVREPFLDPRHAFAQVAACLVGRVHDSSYGYTGQCVAQDGLEVLREAGKGVIVALCSQVSGGGGGAGG